MSLNVSKHGQLATNNLSTTTSDSSQTSQYLSVNELYQKQTDSQGSGLRLENSEVVQYYGAHESTSTQKLALEDLKKASQASRELAKFSLANPSAETKVLVKENFRALGRLIEKYQLDVEDLDFLLEGVPDARSDFSWKYTPDREERLAKLEVLIQNLSHFDEVQDFDKNFAQYAADLDTLFTAIGYRAIGPSWIKNTHEPSERIKALVGDFRGSGFLIPALGAKEFPNRSADDAKNSQAPIAFEIPMGTQEKLHNQEEEKEGLPSRLFTFDSYVAKGLSHGIPMRAHTSGSAPLTLAAQRFVLEVNQTQLGESELVQTGGILCATYDLGDFHTFAETAAGIAHYYQTVFPDMSFLNEKISILEEVDPKTFLALGVGFLQSLVSKEDSMEFDSKSFDVIKHYTNKEPQLKVSPEESTWSSCVNVLEELKQNLPSLDFTTSFLDGRAIFSIGSAVGAA
ncbi:hypothetical protein [Simkania sp.]|uniref:hypothetical protein n=1 Tax=Simkania sp. TaxID=34094 RepID=UPI003B516E71